MTVAEGRARTADGRTFVYTEQGDGPLVVLQHGFPDTPGSWAPAQQVLADAGYRAVAPWLRGYHPETRVEGRAHTPELMGADVLDLIAALGEEPAVVVGHDWGALAGYAAVRQDPERLRGLVTIAIPHPRRLPRDLRAVWFGRHIVAFKLPTGEALARRDDFAYVRQLYRRWSPSWEGEARDAAVSRIVEVFRRDPAALTAALAYYEDLPLGGGTGLAGRVPVPGLIFGGDEDLGGNPEPFRRSCELYQAGCEAVVVEGAGHWAHLERPEPFHRALLAFLHRLDEPSTA